ncbi:SAM hydrolase/SAM-dependent halogenase family protein [Halovivax cerinus]|uniref:S-adenosyl-l-methionine hydroxide adenosyltransferase family protein n=1 Tax=Halovivax cerinus TaxID=1487865 RepID=A0ABD5NKK1_9EURY|nr:SAM-dependent chlorinase/fluorinase [Halovivax cerinus]
MITLASDFGSPYPAAMKGVIRTRSDAELIDVAHDFPRQDVRTAAFWLREVLPYFPPATHLVVVDPGVGTDRAALVVRARDHLLVGPDNGVLLPAARRLAGESTVEPYRWRYDDPGSATFHGRDVFAPAAAAVHDAGIDTFRALDPVTSIDSTVDCRFPTAEVRTDHAEGEVLVVDDFGNVVTNVPGDVLDGAGTVAVDGERIPIVASYAHVDTGERVVTVGSHGNVELAVNRGRGDEAFEVAPGDPVTIGWH